MLFQFFQDYEQYKAGQVAEINDDLGIELQEQEIGEQVIDTSGEVGELEPEPTEETPVQPPAPIETETPVQPEPAPIPSPLPPVIPEPIAPEEKQPTGNRKERRLKKQKKSR